MVDLEIFVERDEQKQKLMTDEVILFFLAVTRKYC